MLTGAAVRGTPKNRLVQQVLRQLIETYGFDRGDIRTDYHPTTKGKRQQKVDVSSLISAFFVNKHGLKCGPAGALVEVDEFVEGVVAAGMRVAGPGGEVLELAERGAPAGAGAERGHHLG